MINETEAKVIKMRFGLDGMVEHRDDAGGG